MNLYHPFSKLTTAVADSSIAELSYNSSSLVILLILLIFYLHTLLQDFAHIGNLVRRKLWALLR